MKERDRSNLIGHISELQKVIRDLNNSNLYSPYNHFFLKLVYVKKYRGRLKRLEKKLSGKVSGNSTKQRINV